MRVSHSSPIFNVLFLSDSLKRLSVKKHDIKDYHIFRNPSLLILTHFFNALFVYPLLPFLTPKVCLRIVCFYIFLVFFFNFIPLPKQIYDAIYYIKYTLLHCCRKHHYHSSSDPRRKLVHNGGEIHFRKHGSYY